MPSKNIVEEPIPDSFYHIYARGNNKQPIFVDNFDFDYFINLLYRYLSLEEVKTQKYYYPSFFNQIKILAYCLKDNHFHLLIYQKEKNGVEKFMRSVMTSYSMYFNLRYHRTGSVFESRYKSSYIFDDDYLCHVSRYIHLNPRSWRRYKYSSLRYYKNSSAPAWLDTSIILSQFKNRKDYYDFVLENETTHNQLNSIKHHLTDIL